MRQSNRMKRILREQSTLPYSLLPSGLRPRNKSGKKSMTALTLNFIRSASSISARRLHKGWS